MRESGVAGGGRQSGLQPGVLHLLEVWENLQYKMSWGEKKKSVLFSLLGGPSVCEQREGLRCLWSERGGLPCSPALRSSEQNPGRGQS